MAPTDRDTARAAHPGSAWAARADELAAWALARVVSRTDKTVRYCEPDGDKNVVTATMRLTPGVLAAHFRARRRSDLLAPLSLAVDSTGRTADIDIDSHASGDEPTPDPEANRAFALALYDRAAALGFAPLLYTSDGLGGFHLRLLFAEPVPAPRLRALARWLSSGHAERGVAKVEVFPKQERASADKPGNGLRLIGKHHTRDAWPQVWNGSEWLKGDAAVDHVLSLAGDSPDLIPDGIEPPEVAGATTKSTKRPVDWVWPSDDYNSRTSFAVVDEMLREAGWEAVRESTGRIDYARPGKDAREGVSGNLKDVGGLPVFWNFSPGAGGFSSGKPYTPSAVLCVLGYAGDFARMTDDLRDRGYGTAAPRAGTRPVAGRSVGTVGTEPGSSPVGDEDVPRWDEPVPFGEDAPPPTFPLDVLPGAFREHAPALAHATQTPPDAPALMETAAAAAGLAKKFQFRVRQGWTQPANLYVALAMFVGERKTSVLRPVTAPVFEAEAEARDAARPRVAEAEAARGAAEARVKHLQNRAAREDDAAERQRLRDAAAEEARALAECAVPAKPVFVADDATPAALARTLIEQGGRLFQCAAEGTCFEIVLGRDSDVEDYDVYLKGHEGDPIRIDRIGRGRTGHDSPALTCGVAIQPDVLRGLGASLKATARGFVARWLYSLPAPRVGSRAIRPAPVPPTAANRYRNVMLRIWRHPLPADGKEAVVEFAADADDALAEFETWLEPQLAPDEPLGGRDGWGSKLAGAVARLAGVFHLVDEAEAGRLGCPEKVPRSRVEAAVRLAKEYLIPHARRAFAAMRADPAEGVARRLLRWIARHPEKLTFTRSEAFQQLKDKGAVQTAAALDPAFGLLADHAYIRAAMVTRTRSGPVPDVFVVNPRWTRTPGLTPPDPHSSPDVGGSGGVPETEPPESIPKVPKVDPLSDRPTPDFGDSGDGFEEVEL
jgi:replicative DNA helicase